MQIGQSKVSETEILELSEAVHKECSDASNISKRKRLNDPDTTHTEHMNPLQEIIMGCLEGSKDVRARESTT